MKVGVLKEIKTHEHRVALTPGGARALAQAGHSVLIEQAAGEGSGFPDAEYERAGAKIAKDAAGVWGDAELILKVKEPLKQEFQYFRKGLTIFTYFHLANEPELAKALLTSGVTAIAYETVQTNGGELPLLKPMSEVAGRMAVQIGANCLRKDLGGRGVLLSGLPGVRAGQITIIGAGVVGMNALKMAVGLGAQVRVLDVNQQRLAYLDDLYGGRILTLISTPDNIEESIRYADLLVGAVLIPGAKAPKLVTKKMISQMAPGTVVLDVSVDQGGCVETCRPTTHEDPTYDVDGVIHYCVTNIPGTVARTSTLGLTNATIFYVLKLAGRGIMKALKEDQALAKGLNVFEGAVTHEAVARSLELPFRTLLS